MSALVLSLYRVARRESLTGEDEEDTEGNNLDDETNE